jgi:hypothetical protein
MTSAKLLPFGIQKQDYSLRRQEAAFCYFYYFWTGNDIMFSTGYAMRECKVTGKISSWIFTIEINPKGPTAFDEWKQDNWDYIPDGYICSFEQLAAMPNTSWEALTLEQLQQRFQKERLNLALKRAIWNERPILYDHWAFGSPSDRKKRNRKQWQETYKMRKAYKKVTEAEYFQLRLRGLNPSA